MRGAWSELCGRVLLGAGSLVVLAATLSGCEPARGPRLPPVVAPAPSASSAAPAGGAEAQRFATLRDDLLDAWLEAEPAWARQLGLHERDGEVADLSPAALAAHLAWLRQAERSLAEIDSAALGPGDTLDLAILRGRLALARFEHEVMRLPHTRPQSYDVLFNVSGYLDFAYAPLEQRAERLVAHEEAALAQVPHIYENLDPVMSRTIVQTAVGIFEGHASYLRGDVRRLLGGVGDAAFQARFTRANDALAAAAEGLARRLESEYLPRGDDSHVLGRERYLRFVEVQEGRRYELAAFKAMAEEDLGRNKAAYAALRGEVTVTRPARAELLEVATRMMNDARAFVVERGIATIPSEDRAQLEETPPFMAWNAAFLNMPGPYDSAKQAYYYITLPDPGWTTKEQEDYIFPLGTLLATTVHEVYPGHFLHGLWVRRAPSRMQKMADSYSFTEGWAHYTEQMMIEEGFGAANPESRLGQLSDALLRNCRFVVSIGVHAEGMSLEQAAQRFEDDCFQDKATARQQAARATFDPGYFAYTLGKLQILALRQEAKQRLGDRFDLKRFHDALLSHGAPPVALVAERVLAELQAP